MKLFQPMGRQNIARQEFQTKMHRERRQVREKPYIVHKGVTHQSITDKPQPLGGTQMNRNQLI